jgi:hypothetical protein
LRTPALSTMKLSAGGAIAAGIACVAALVGAVGAATCELTNAVAPSSGLKTRA